MSQPIRTSDVAVGTGTLRVHEQGEGPLVVLLHGFPECAHSWRHQMTALADAGYRAVAPNQRGYADSYTPYEAQAYDIVELTSDVAGLIEALGADDAVVVGHDWGASVAYHTALLHPGRVRAVAGLSIPWGGRAPLPPLQRFRAAFRDRFFYILYFQQEGVAEAELEADVRLSLRSFYGSIVGSAPPRDRTYPADGTGLLDTMIDPGTLPDCMTEADFEIYVSHFERSGLRGPLNWYRSLDRSWERTPQLVDRPIEQPSLFLAGSHDPVLGFTRGALEQMPDAMADLRELRILPGAGHLLQQERPSEVTASLLAFLDSL